MSHYTIGVQYRFHSAGQGIFASGTLQADPHADRFHWVFDCGSISLAEVLRPVLSRYRSLVVDDFLNLLCISHFDCDHVNGLTDLLDGLRVETVVIPYYSKAERLTVAARELDPTPEYLAFLSDPIAFILENAGSVGQIIVVGGAEGDADDLQNLGRIPTEPAGDLRDFLDGPRRESAWRFKPSEWPNLDIGLVADEGTVALAHSLGTSIRVCPGSLEAAAFNPQVPVGWEFLFFHKPIAQKLREDLLKNLRKLLPTSLSVGSTKDLLTLLQNEVKRKLIKKAYFRSIVGKVGKEDLNSTSLCSYTGPQLVHLADCWITRPWPDLLMTVGRGSEYWHEHTPWNCSALYTGDANLKPLANREELREFLTLNRWYQIAVLQVPHHGSRENWESGCSGEFSNTFSIFCADENHKRHKHPHREVVLDLMERGPHLANKTQSWTLIGRAHFTTT
ncbi:hypothetical protein OKA05_16895 [Luteolibacter arcticus]|uniref:Metallo-beta-lactamase domain-containing protein n=1 Tax=Luteolibacter arcticus TaxID=1581411 RepID=A0ABT3GL49_9BACT|nr:hypothetical protein [Luteolibacter arcticus]MCW1924247.1 hypothetical protein [Luteolibacter arcticus]